MIFPATAELALNELNHVMIIGQSNGVGNVGTGPVVTLAPIGTKYGRHMIFEGGIHAGCEGLGAGVYPVNYSRLRYLKEDTDTATLDAAAETIASGFAAYIGARTSGAHRLLLSNCARNNSAYAQLAKGTNPYERGWRHIREGCQHQNRYGIKTKVRALLSVQGENDINSGTYGTDMRQWQLDWETDINASTGRTGTLPIFHTQCGVGNFAPGNLGLLSEHKTNPTKTTLVGPCYFMLHSDGVHRFAEGHRWLGEYYGKAYYKQVVLGQQWEPLRPTTVARAGAVITATFSSAVGPLVLDTTTVSNPGNYGFTYFDDTAPPAISSVALQAPNQVVVTLAGVPTGAGKVLRYGYGTADNFAGPTRGRRGCLRDSDPDASQFGNTLYNWCVCFEEAAT